MSWASYRKTTRTEDLAYCLMGIFGVNLPLLYGEGEKAFTRLQEEIMKHNYDHSLFAWNYHFPVDTHETKLSPMRSLAGVGILAPYPSAFSNSAHIVPLSKRTEPYAMTNMGLAIHLRIFQPLSPFNQCTTFARLECSDRTKGSSISIGIPITPVSENEFYRIAHGDVVTIHYRNARDLGSRKVYLSSKGSVWRPEQQPNRCHCWLREFGQHLGVRLVKAQYCQYPVVESDLSFQFWKKDDNAITMDWEKSWRGIRTVLLFSKDDELYIRVVLTILRPLWPGGNPAMQLDVKITSGEGIIMQDWLKLQVQRIEQSRYYNEAEGTGSWGSHTVFAHIKREDSHDKDIFTLSLALSNSNHNDSMEFSLAQMIGSKFR
ncbi:hypothetical protein GQ44DRAFT_606357 [Phaeosphaeriaceae sp. PMI808]|nr:hypothetical protein GQ44DRAFT_606357 [Phaeosphaeriaceae sp. PMI808]